MLTRYPKGKSVPFQARNGPEGSRNLRFSDFVTTAQNGGEFVSLRHGPALPLGKTPGNIGKSVPLQAWCGPEGSRKLRISDFVTTVQDGGEFVSLTHRPLLLPGITPGTHFC